MDSTAYDGQRSSDVDIKDPWKDIAVAAVLPRRQHCRIRDDIHWKEMVQALGSCGIDAGEDWERVKAGLYKNERTGRCYFC